MVRKIQMANVFVILVMPEMATSVAKILILMDFRMKNSIVQTLFVIKTIVQIFPTLVKKILIMMVLVTVAMMIPTMMEFRTLLIIVHLIPILDKRTRIQMD